MKSSTALANLAAVLRLVSAAPHPVAENKIDPSASQQARTAVFTADSIEKRDDIPDFCWAMIDSRQQGAQWRFYWYNDIDRACAVESLQSGMHCGEDGYWDKQLDPMEECIAQQVTKDGQFESSTVGMWKANFATFTTAVGDRDGYKSFVNKILRENIPNVEAPRRAWNYRFIFHGDIIHLNLDNSGLFDPNCPQDPY